LPVTRTEICDSKRLPTGSKADRLPLLPGAVRLDQDYLLAEVCGEQAPLHTSLQIDRYRADGDALDLSWTRKLPGVVTAVCRDSHR
jgi:hypothetical protein